MGRALIVMESDFDRQKAKHWVDKAPVGTRIEFKASKRTLPQNDLFWAILTEVSQQVTHAGNRYDPTEWKAMFLHAYGREVRFLPGLDGKTFLPIEQSSSDLSKQEMTDLIEFILSWGAQNGVTFREHTTDDQDNEDTGAALAGTDDARSPEPSSEPAGSPSEPAGSLIQDGGNQPSPEEGSAHPPRTSPVEPSPIPEKELVLLRRFAKDVLHLADKPETSGEVMTKVVNRWFNMELANVQSEAGRAAVKSIHGSVKAIMKGHVSLGPALEFHAEGLGCSIEELGGIVDG